jgi:D-tyrosyl-tRNA(Tyr) deacylase
MRAVLQRVTRACVRVKDEVLGEIDSGIVVLLGVAHDDAEPDIKYLVEKIAAIRIFDDADGRMNLSIRDVGGALRSSRCMGTRDAGDALRGAKRRSRK